MTKTMIDTGTVDALNEAIEEVAEAHASVDQTTLLRDVARAFDDVLGGVRLAIGMENRILSFPNLGTSAMPFHGVNLRTHPISNGSGSIPFPARGHDVGDPIYVVTDDLVWTRVHATRRRALTKVDGTRAEPWFEFETGAAGPPTPGDLTTLVRLLPTLLKRHVTMTENQVKHAKEAVESARALVETLQRVSGKVEAEK